MERKRPLFRFDTRDVKPKLYDAAAVSGLYVFLFAILFLRPGGPSTLQLSALTVIYLAVILGLLVAAFFKQTEYNPYSYNTIYYMGVALFVLSVLITVGILTCRQVTMPDVYGAETVMRVLLNSAKRYVLFSFPFILVFAGALCLSNIALIRHEGGSLVNVLGIILSFLLVAGALVLWRIDYYMTGSLAEVRLQEILSNLYASLYLYFECMMIGTIVADGVAAVYEPLPDKDFVIILGCGLKEDGMPTPLLQGRIDRAAGFVRKQEELTGKKAVFVASGGKGDDEPVTEAEAIARSLLAMGFPEERIIREEASRNTYENMKFSKEKILARDPGGKVAFATTNYHVFRSGLFARRVKMRAVGMGAGTKWYFWPNAAVREFIGLLTQHRLKQILVFSGMAAVYTALALLVYR